MIISVLLNPFCLQKKDLKMLSVQVICCIYLLTLLTNVSLEANSVDPDQTSPVRLL